MVRLSGKNTVITKWLTVITTVTLYNDHVTFKQLHSTSYDHFGLKREILRRETTSDSAFENSTSRAHRMPRPVFAA